MHVKFTTNPARRTEMGGFQVRYFTGPKTPERAVEAANLKDLLAQFETFKAEAEATGFPLIVSFMQHPRDTSRKFPGYEKAAKAARHLTAAAEKASEDDLDAFTK